MQLFARDANNFGHFEIEGRSVTEGTLRSVVSEMSSGTIVELFNLEVKPNMDFQLKHKIPSCLKEYQLQVFFTGSSQKEKRLIHRGNLLAGDFYLAAGQSNVSCPQSEGWEKHDSIYNSPFTRAIGGDFSWANTLKSDSSNLISLDIDCMFGRTSSEHPYYKDHGFSGLWPMKLQYELANSSGIPNCIINSSRGGVGISAHFASHTPSHPDSLRYEYDKKTKLQPQLYDRAYKKFYMNNAVAAVKGIFWYQGETDGTYDRDSSANYDKRFQKLYNSWKADYPSLKKIFVVQINLGCGGEYHNLIREIQRKFPEKYNDVVVMSSLAAPFSDRSADFCHYTVKGYARIASKLLPLAKHYLYGFPLNEDLTIPANIQKASYVEKNVICLEFNKNIILQDSCVYGPPHAGTAYMKNSFFNDLNVEIKIDSIIWKKNKVFLHLSPVDSIVTRISYLPNIFSPIPSFYGGPWILNESNTELGAYSFFEFPVSPLQIPAKKHFGIFPNPADKELNLQFREDQTRKITLHDLHGKQILSTEVTTVVTTLNLSELPEGIYILSVKTSDELVLEKIVVMH